MASFLTTVRKVDGVQRFYMDGTRIEASQWDAVTPDFDVHECHSTTETPTHWRHRFEGRKSYAA